MEQTLKTGRNPDGKEPAGGCEGGRRLERGQTELNGKKTASAAPRWKAIRRLTVGDGDYGGVVMSLRLLGTRVWSDPWEAPRESRRTRQRTGHT